MKRIALTVFLLLAGLVGAGEPITELPGNLVIVGGGEIPESIHQKFVTLAGGDKARIVIIPTASESADRAGEKAAYLEPWRKLKPASVVLLHTRDRKVADSDEFIKPLMNATGVWFGGGVQTRVTEAYLGTKAETAFHNVLSRGGTLGGTSAGAALMSDPMITGGTTTATIGKGFGFLPGFVTDQHFLKRNRQNRLKGVLEKHPGLVGIGIDESTAAIVSGRRVEILGESTATLYIASGGGRPWFEQSLKAREVADLFQLRRAAQNRNVKEPFPPAIPAKPVVAKGSLVMVGGGETTAEVMDRFFTLAGGKDALIVAVPTTGDGDGDAKFLRKWGATNVKVLSADSKQANDPDYSKVLLEAKGVWFGGGRQWKFVDAFESTLTLKCFQSVLERGGVIGGSSAGASIQGEYMPRGHPLGNTVVAAEGYERGFGFLPGCAIDQHFFARKRTADMTGLIKRYPQYLGIGIDEGTAIVVTGSTAVVLGKGKVAFYDAAMVGRSPDYVEVASGGKYDLAARKTLAP